MGDSQKQAYNPRLPPDYKSVATRVIVPIRFSLGEPHAGSSALPLKYYSQRPRSLLRCLLSSFKQVTNPLANPLTAVLSYRWNPYWRGFAGRYSEP